MVGVAGGEVLESVLLYLMMLELLPTIIFPSNIANACVAECPPCVVAEVA
jgi:hypothetical protein